MDTKKKATLLITAGTYPAEAILTKASGSSLDNVVKVKVGDCFKFSDETESPLRKITGFTRSGIEYNYVLRSLNPEKEGVIRIHHVGLSRPEGTHFPEWNPPGMKGSIMEDKEIGNAETFELVDCPRGVPPLRNNAAAGTKSRRNKKSRRAPGRSRRNRRNRRSQRKRQ